MYSSRIIDEIDIPLYGINYSTYALENNDKKKTSMLAFDGERGYEGAAMNARNGY